MKILPTNNYLSGDLLEINLINYLHARPFRLILTLSLVSLLVSPIFFSAQAADIDLHTYIPLVRLTGMEDTCQGGLNEQTIAEFMTTDPDQKRPILNCDPTLAQIAQLRAQDMADRDYFSHTNPEGFGPNYLVQQAGYLLPAFYNLALDANNIETIHGGSSTASGAWTSLMNSDPHQTHLLGLISFYAEQIDYGIGYAYNPNSTYHHYWVIITGRH